MHAALDDSDGDSDSDDGEGLLGKGTTGRLAGVLEGRTLGAALKATSVTSAQKLGGRPLGSRPLGGGPLGGAVGGASSLAPLSKVGGIGGGSLAPIGAGGSAGRPFR